MALFLYDFHHTRVFFAIDSFYILPFGHLCFPRAWLATRWHHPCDLSGMCLNWIIEWLRLKQTCEHANFVIFDVLGARLIEIVILFVGPFNNIIYGVREELWAEIFFHNEIFEVVGAA